MSKSRMVIRPYLATDEKAIIELWRKCNLTHPSYNNPKLDIERKQRVNPELFLVGLIGDRVVATVMGGYDGHRGWVNSLAVDPKYQRRGLGRQIMEAIEKKLSLMGCPKIKLQIRGDNLMVTQFYEHIGYKKDEVIVMGKRLVEN